MIEYLLRKSEDLYDLHSCIGWLYDVLTLLLLITPPFLGVRKMQKFVAGAYVKKPYVM